MKAYDVNQFLDLERQVWEALLTGDMEKDAGMLAENFLGLYETGFSNRAEHAQELADGPIVSEYEISEERIMVLADDLVLLAYLAEYVGAGNHANGTQRMYVSSIWQNNSGTWENVFSQDTHTNS